MIFANLIQNISGTIFELNYVPLIITVFSFIVIYWSTKWALDRRASGEADWNIYKTIILFLIGFVGFLSIIYSLPLGDELRGNITSLLGIVISGVLAFSSATFIGNGLAGILLRVIRNFKPGDFIEVGEYFGRVTERGLFHTEIQTQNSDLTTIPNMYLADNPVNVKRSSGTIISGLCSLGYDVNRILIEETLIKAALKAKLSEPFVRITELGDFSVGYEVFGKVKETKTLLTAQSRLKAMMLDELHEAGIEIVSPNFMNQRQLGSTTFIPKKMKENISAGNASEAPESSMFDKADDAQSLEELRAKALEIENRLQNLDKDLKTSENSDEIQSMIQRWNIQKVRVQEKIDIKTQEIAAKQ